MVGLDLYHTVQIAYSTICAAQFSGALYSNWSRAAFCEVRKVAWVFQCASAAALAWQVYSLVEIAGPWFSSCASACFPPGIVGGVFVVGGGLTGLVVFALISYVAMYKGVALINHYWGPSIDLNPRDPSKIDEHRAQITAAINEVAAQLAACNPRGEEHPYALDVTASALLNLTSLKSQLNSLLAAFTRLGEEKKQFASNHFTFVGHRRNNEGQFIPSYELPPEGAPARAAYFQLNEAYNQLGTALRSLRDIIHDIEAEEKPPQLRWTTTLEQHRSQTLLAWQIVCSVALTAFSASPYFHAANLALQLASYYFISRPKSVEFKYCVPRGDMRVPEMQSVTVYAYFLAHFVSRPKEDAECSICLEELTQPSPHLVSFGCDAEHLTHTLCITQWIKEKIPAIIQRIGHITRRVTTVRTRNQYGRITNTYDIVKYEIILPHASYPSCPVCRGKSNEQVFVSKIIAQDRINNLLIGLRTLDMPTTVTLQ